MPLWVCLIINETLNLEFVLPMMFYCIGRLVDFRFFCILWSVQVIFGTNRMPNVLTGFTDFRTEDILDNLLLS